MPNLLNWQQIDEDLETHNPKESSTSVLPRKKNLISQVYNLFRDDDVNPFVQNDLFMRMRMRKLKNAHT